MNLNNVLNIVGILLTLAGAVLLFFIDHAPRKLAVAEKDLPDDMFVDTFAAARDGVERIPTPEEERYTALGNAINPKRALTIYRVALVLIVLSGGCQIIAACV